MPTIFELFGYPVADQSLQVQQSRSAALCPFMGRECDGGGNRELSRISLSAHPGLQRLFPNHQQPNATVAAGVCSIQVVTGDTPWIVCPRRLLALGREASGVRSFQGQSETLVLKYLGYPVGTRLGIWPEVKLKISTEVSGTRKLIDSTLDYVLMPVGRVPLVQIAGLFPLWSERRLQSLLAAAGYKLNMHDDTAFVEDFPVGIPSIIEIMTCSTSGGNKRTRTTIPMAFEDAILGKAHQAPGINYRQVWARMVSQLTVKSEFGLAWGGKTLWVVQDKLLDYISSTTALTLKNFLAQRTSDVNMVSFSYTTDQVQSATGVLDLATCQLYAGQIAATAAASTTMPSIQDITRAPFTPSREALLALLAARAPVNQVVAPEDSRQHGAAHDDDV